MPNWPGVKLNEERIPEIVNEVLENWIANPDLSFGDLLKTLQARVGTNISVFDWKDDQVLGALRGMTWAREQKPLRPQDKV